ncbi:hypothetical protein [Allocoleopsis sp.]|uniref:hypothetical protein n=1 Tax=Allocoleopsis sp. TaxID=3088169 RepID=UPI002FD74119
MAEQCFPLTKREIETVSVGDNPQGRIANDSEITKSTGAFRFMNSTSMTVPRFNRNQIVRFSGGIGTIKSYRPNSNQSWIYAIEMEMGPEPDFGRVGFETTILLHEAEIQA